MPSNTSPPNGLPQLGAQIAPLLVVCALVFALPLVLNNDFLLNKIARYLVLGILTVSLALSWGFGGILNLGQAMSFGIGSYAMAMALKLKTVPVHTGSGGLPDFMVWNNVAQLPWFWVPFKSLSFALAAGVLVPALVAAALGWFIFRSRVTGVYVSIITLATMVVLNLVIIDQQSYTGGFNGITDLAQLEIFGIAFDAYGRATYYLSRGRLRDVEPSGCLHLHPYQGRARGAGDSRPRGPRALFRLRRRRVSDICLQPVRRDRGPRRDALHDRDGVRIADLPWRAALAVGGRVVCGRWSPKPGWRFSRRGAGGGHAGRAL
jgi:hypothetical protein